ncbi:hypothetical protein [Arcticibacter sp. MXS-1]|uniref:hypothetical protein n=1 Tax=Arcticibacter sp. MXS-1 TaxID=3341726 RepID=UPI0035A87AE2
MQQDEFNYREQVLSISCMLSVVHREFYVYGLNAALCGELADLKEIFEEGEEYPGDVALLEALDDENIRILLSAMHAVARHSESILNLNSITGEELESALEEGIGEEYVPEYFIEEEMDYLYWMKSTMAYIHFAAHRILLAAYLLSHRTTSVPELHEADLYFPTDESILLLSLDDQNVRELSDLAFELSALANELCESL